MRWLFPGQLIRVDAPCLDCGEPLRIEMRDETIQSVDPPTMVGYTRSPVGGSAETRPFRCAGMNLFRSEAHARTWTEYDPAMETTLRPVAFWADLFGTPIFRERGRVDYVSWLQSEHGQAGFLQLRSRLPH